MAQKGRAVNKACGGLIGCSDYRRFLGGGFFPWRIGLGQLYYRDFAIRQVV